MNALVAENEQWRLQESSLDLYSGATGTGLALAAAHYVEGIDIQEERLDALVEAVANEVAHGRDRRAIGLFNGLAGMLYFLACMARYDQRHSKVVKSAVHAGLEQLEASVQEDSRYDIISGSAGVLVLADRLLRARMAAPSLARAAIERCVSTLAGAAEPLHPGAIVWRNTDDDWLGGLSHGVAGIGWALSHARGTVADKLARGAWLSQLTLRRSGMEWEDRRKSAGGAGRPFNAWCHGADGIVLAALDYRTSTDSLRSKHFGEWVYSDPVDDPSLCHGRAGRLALLSHIRDSVKLGKSLAVDQAVLSTAISEMRRQVVQDLERSFRGKDDRFALDDGLMVGSAGALISLLIERHGPRTANPLTVSLPR